MWEFGQESWKKQRIRSSFWWRHSISWRFSPELSYCIRLCCIGSQDLWWTCFFHNTTGSEAWSFPVKCNVAWPHSEYHAIGFAGKLSGLSSLHVLLQRFFICPRSINKRQQGMRWDHLLSFPPLVFVADLWAVNVMIWCNFLVDLLLASVGKARNSNKGTPTY